MEKLERLLFIAFSAMLPLVADADWDVVFGVAHIYESPVAYTNQDILVADSGFLSFCGGLTLNNSHIRIEGAVECNSNITLINSTIEVLGTFNIAAGVDILETGASSIIATGNSSLEGIVDFRGNIYNKIVVYSDYSAGDTDFLIIDPNSSPDSKIEHIVFYGGFSNIWVVNKRLNTPINNCFFFGADYGIWQDGVDELTDIRFCLFVDTYTAIGLIMQPTIAQTAEVVVDNVIIDNPSVLNSFGCYISGSQSQTKYGFAHITNTIFTNTYCGWYVNTDTYLAINLENAAYYGNDYDDNLLDSSSLQENPMYLAQSPFETPASSSWQYFINPQSPVADVELKYNLLQVCPEQLQASLFSEPAPRNKGIGVGVPLPPDYSCKLPNLPADFNFDGIVNNLDYTIFASQWGADSNSIANFNDSNSVDTLDLVYFCESWLSDGSIRLKIVDETETLTATFREPNGLEDCLFAFYLNGEYLTTRDADNPILTIYKANYPNGEYYLRAIVIGEDETGTTQHYATQSHMSVFETPLSNFTVARTFDKDKGLTISGQLADGYEIELKVIADEQILWTNTFSDDFIAIVDPNSLAANSASYEVLYTYQPDMILSVLDYLPLDLQQSLLAANQSSGQRNALSLEGKPDFSTAGLIICMLADGMNEGVGMQDTGTARYAERMFRQRGIKTILLKGFGNSGEVTQNTLAKVFRKYPKINYAHIYAHGNYRMFAPWFLGRVQRTGLNFNDGFWPAYNSKHWTGQGHSVPQDYQWLRGKYEKGPSLEDLAFAPGQLKILVLESCYGLRNVATRRANGIIDYIQGAYEYELSRDMFFWNDYPYSDVCFSFGLDTSSQVVLGFGDTVIKSGFYSYYQEFFNRIWWRLGEGDNFADALAEARSLTTVIVRKNNRIRGIPNSFGIYLKNNP